MTGLSQGEEVLLDKITEFTIEAGQSCWENHTFCYIQFIHVRVPHRRRIKTEEKAKVVASVWVEEFIQFLAALAVLYWTI